MRAKSRYSAERHLSAKDEGSTRQIYTRLHHIYRVIVQWHTMIKEISRSFPGTASGFQNSAHALLFKDLHTGAPQLCNFHMLFAPIAWRL